MDALCCGCYLLCLLDIRQLSLVLLRDMEGFVAKRQLRPEMFVCF